MRKADEDYIAVEIYLSKSDRHVLEETGFLDPADISDERAIEAAIRARILDVAMPPLERQRQLLDSYCATNGRVWGSTRLMGPPPGSRGCLISHRLMFELAEQLPRLKPNSIAANAASAILLAAARSTLSESMERSIVHSFLRTRSWYEVWGPRPGKAGCKIDPVILDEYRDEIAKIIGAEDAAA